MKKKIGILGGISYASSIKYYETIMALYYERFKDYYYPEVIIHSLDFQYFTDLEDERRLQEYEDYILYSIQCLERAGAEFVIMAANSPHSVLEQVKTRTNMPILNIVDAIGMEARKNNMKKLLLTGIKYTMQSSFYKSGIEKYGIQVITPNDMEQNAINEIIFKELALNHIFEESRKKILDIINRYTIDGVILGCTELPLLLDSKCTEIPLLNSLHLHCQMTLAYTLAEGAPNLIKNL